MNFLQRRADRLFRGTVNFNDIFQFGSSTNRGAFAPCADTGETSDATRLCLEIPVVDERYPRILTANGIPTGCRERKLEESEKREHFLRMGQAYGAIRRTFACLIRSMPGTSMPIV